MTSGNNTVVMVQCSSASITRRLRAVKREKNSKDSECGSEYAFLTLGPNPSRSTIVKMTTAQSGLAVKYQSGNDDKVQTKNNQSV